MCLRVAHLNLEETFWYAVHFLDLHASVLWAFMTRRGGRPGDAAYSLLAAADARLVEDAAARKGRDGRHGWEEVVVVGEKDSGDVNREPQPIWSSTAWETALAARAVHWTM